MKSAAIGIDLGTTNSCGSVLKCGKIEIFPNEDGNRITPSYVAFTDTERLVGDPAKKQIALNPQNTVYDAKRLIGRRFNDETVERDKNIWPFAVINDNDIPKIEVNYKEESRVFSAQEISSMILVKIKQAAEMFLENKVVSDAVITVPAYFNDSQRRATQDAAKIAGLNVLRIINEPTAAAISYGLVNKDVEEKTILIFDLGGGTFDVSILNVGGGEINVLATDGDTHLGGEDFDIILVEHFVKEIKCKKNVDLKDNKKAIQKLKKECEYAKKLLSTAHQTDVTVDSLYDGIDFQSRLTRAKFEELCANHFQQTIDVVERCLKSAKLEKKDIDELILVGGSTRIPKVQKLLRDAFGGKQLNQSVHVDEAVAHGAAVLASNLSGKTIKEDHVVTFSDVTPLSLGIFVNGDKMSVLISKNTTIPTTKMKPYETSFENQTAINVKVYEGESTVATQNHFLGSICIKDLPKGPAGKYKIEVTFSIDRNGVLTVTAKNLENVEWREIRIVDNGGMSKEDIEKMVTQAEKFNEEDKEMKLRSLAKNAFQDMISDISQKLSDELVSTVDVPKLKKLCEEGEIWIEENENAKIPDIQQAQKELEKVWKIAKTRLCKS